MLKEASTACLSAASRRLWASGASVVAYSGVATVFGSEGIFTLRLVPTALVIAVVNAALTQPAMKVLRFAVIPGDRRPV